MSAPLLLPRGRGSSGGAANTYIKISEAEIADDYPMPKQYEKVRTSLGCAGHAAGQGADMAASTCHALWGTLPHGKPC